MLPIVGVHVALRDSDARPGHYQSPPGPALSSPARAAAQQAPSPRHASGAPAPRRTELRVGPARPPLADCCSPGETANPRPGFPGNPGRVNFMQLLCFLYNAYIPLLLAGPRSSRRNRTSVSLADLCQLLESNYYQVSKIKNASIKIQSRSVSLI